MRLIYILLVLILINSFSFAQNTEWDIPENKQNEKSSFVFTDDIKKEGQTLYKANCNSCHGDPTKGNFQPLNPIPTDLGSKEFQKQSDGTIFFKITNGRGLMPSFRDVINEDDRWKIVSYIRSFNDSYVQDVTSQAVENVNTEGKVFLEMSFEEASKIIQVKAFTKKDSIIEHQKGIQISLFAKRYFGKLPISEQLTTDDNGLIKFFPDTNINGNSEGKVLVIARCVNEINGEIPEISDSLKIGKVTIVKNILDERHIWGTRAKTPIWLIFSYFGVVGFVWFFILKIVFGLRKIKEDSEKSN